MIKLILVFNGIPLKLVINTNHLRHKVHLYTSVYGTCLFINEKIYTKRETQLVQFLKFIYFFNVLSKLLEQLRFSSNV